MVTLAVQGRAWYIDATNGRANVNWTLLACHCYTTDRSSRRYGCGPECK